MFFCNLDYHLQDIQSIQMLDTADTVTYVVIHYILGSDAIFVNFLQITTTHGKGVDKVRLRLFM